MQIIHKKKTNTKNKTFLLLQYRTLKCTVQYDSWHTGAGISEQARRVPDWRKERRWEMIELKDHQR